MSAAIKVTKPTCECGDPGCPVHRNATYCTNAAVTVMVRVDMLDKTGTAMCAGCARDSQDSGLFYEDKGLAILAGLAGL